MLFRRPQRAGIRVSRRTRIARLAALPVLVAAMLAVTPAALATGTEDVLQYEFETERVPAPPPDFPTIDYAVVGCENQSCRLIDMSIAQAEAGAPAFTVPGRLEFSSAGSGTCDSGIIAPQDVALTFSETGISGTVIHQEYTVDCGGGQSVTTERTSWTLVHGMLTRGECHFTSTGCSAVPLVPSQEPEPTPAATGTDGSEPAAEAPEEAGAADDRTTFSQLASGDPAAPSVLSALQPPTSDVVAPQRLAVAALVTVVLVLLMAFPTSLLNAAIEGAGDRFSLWRERRGASKPPAWRGSWWWAAMGVLAAAVISAFVDPQFGLNPGSARVIVSIALSFALEVVLGWVVLMWLMRRLVPGVSRSFSFRPLSLVIVVLAVVFTRATGFEPGIVFGLVAGLGFATTLGVAARARSTLVPLAYAFGLGLVAWLAFGLVADASGDSLGMTLLVETLASLTVGGMVALPLALVPIKGLGGYTVWQADARLWGLCYAIGLFAFIVVLMPVPSSWSEVGWELGAWIAVYVAYALVAVTAWLLVKQPWRREQSSTVASSPSPSSDGPDAADAADAPDVSDDADTTSVIPSSQGESP